MREGSITELFIARDEAALSECRRLYGAECLAVAERILGRTDAEEAVNDALLAAWQSIPPQTPRSMGAYLAALTRRCAVDILRKKTRLKRGGGEYEASLDELASAVASNGGPESELEAALLRDAIARFLALQPKKSRVIFLRRYWWLQSVEEIASEMLMSRSGVKMQLSRTRDRLKDFLIREGFEI